MQTQIVKNNIAHVASLNKYAAICMLLKASEHNIVFLLYGMQICRKAMLNLEK